MNTLGPLIFPALLGISFLYALLNNSAIRCKNIYILSCGPVFGLCLTSLIVYSAYVLQAAHHRWIIIGGIYLSTICSILWGYSCYLHRNKTKSCPSRPIPSWSRYDIVMAILLAVSIMNSIQYFWGYLLLNPHGGWDARYLWHMKALFMFRDPLEWTRLFSPILGWNNHDYPLMNPSLVAWGWIWLKSEAAAWPAILSFAMYLCGGGLIYSYVRGISTRCWALLSVLIYINLHPVRFWAAALYVDTALSGMLTFSAVTAVLALRQQDPKMLGAAGFLMGCSAWIKNEGLLFAALLSAAVFIALSRKKTMSGSSRFKAFLCFILSALPPLLCVLSVKIFSSTGSYLFTDRTFNDYAAMITDTGRLKYIAATFLMFQCTFAKWNLLWVASWGAALCLIFSKGRSRSRPLSWIFVYLYLAAEGVYFLIFAISPTDIQFHLQTALERLLLHLSGFAILCIFEAFSPETEPEIPLSPAASHGN